MDILFGLATPDIWSTLLSEFGPLVGVVLFFIWRDWKREDNLSSRVSQLEEYQRETLAGIADRSTTALIQNAECFKWVCRVLERFCQYFPQASLPNTFNENINND